MSAKLVIAVVVAAGLALGPVSATASVPESEPATNSPGGLSAPEGGGASSGLMAAAATFEADRNLIFQQANTLRVANGLAPLRRNAALDEIAQDWAVQQARVSTMSHRPDFTGMYPAGWTRAAENVAYGYAPDEVHDAWATSPGHRANLLSANTDIGIGIAANVNGRLYYTQNFGRYASAPPTPPGAVARTAGDDRFATSAVISQRAFPGGARTVYAASGLAFPDALSAAALAGSAGGPLLLVQPTAVPSVIMAELRRLQPTTIVVAGGRGVVSDAVIDTLLTVTPNVRRVFGANRYETSRNLAEDVYGSRGADTVFLATGTGFADALAAGPAAASIDAPVVLVPGMLDEVDDDTLALLTQLRTTKVVVVGGTSVVSEGIAQSLRTVGITVERLSGADRFSTATIIAQRYFASATSAYIANGYGFADALSGGAAAGALGAPLYTSRNDCVPSVVHSALIAQQPATLVLLGGLGSLRPAVGGFYRC